VATISRQEMPAELVQERLPVPTNHALAMKASFASGSVQDALAIGVR
jgi:hypothetical protein